MEHHIWRLEWDDSLSIGIPEIDQDHQNFILLINGLNQAIVDRMNLSEIQRRMQLILDDSKQHFAHEEELFKLWHYPDADEHARKHGQITRQLHEIKAALNQKSTEYTWIEAGLTAKEMLLDHLLNEDMKYRDYYRSKPH